MTKIINLFGAPGSGKSTLASGLFYEMKLKGLNVELASEWIKSKLFEGTNYPFKDQLYTFAKQNKKLREMLGKVDYIICDSPIVQGLVYDTQEPEIFTQTVLTYFNTYDNINFLLKRCHKYQQEGRVQNEQQSDEVGTMIENKLNELGVPFTTLPTINALENILNIFYLLENKPWAKK